MMERKKVLVVEKDAALRHVYWRNLTFEGFYVLTAPDGATAIECLQHHTPAVIVLDMNVVGWQLHQELAENQAYRNIPVIGIGGAPVADVTKQVAAMFVEPVPIERIIEEVRRHARAA